MNPNTLCALITVKNPRQRLVDALCVRVGLLLLMCLAIGCKDKTGKAFIPKSSQAEEALDVALKEWESGKTFGTIQGYRVPIEFFDGRWQKGKKLESFEIVGEEETEGPKIFLVKMKVAGEEEAETKYYILGTDTLFISAEKEYLKDAGM